jgi:hypothetical protein
MKVRNNSKTTLRAFRGASYLALTLLTLGCSQGGFSSGSNPSTSDGGESIKNNADTIVFDEVATVPLIKGAAGGSYIVKISNMLDQKYFLKKIRVINPLTGKEDKSLATVNSALCPSIAANNTCGLNIKPQLSQSGSFILEADLIGEDKTTKTIRQIIRVSDKIVSNNGIAYKNDIAAIVTSNGKYSLSIPVVLTENFDKITATNGSLVCNDGFNKNTSCSYLLSGDTLGDNTLLETKLTGYKKNKAVSTSSYNTRVTTSINANLLLSQPADIEIVESAIDSRTVLTIFNSGNLNATNVTSDITVGNLRIVSGDNTTCGSLLAPHSDCNIEIEGFGQSNGSGSIQVSYNASAEREISSIANILYTVAGTPLPSVSFSNIAGGLENTARGTTSTLDLRIANNGRYNLSNVRFNISPDNQGNGSFVISGRPAGDGIVPCSTGGTQTLVTTNHVEPINPEDEDAVIPSSFCDLRISYTAPDASVSGNVVLGVSADYTDGHSADNGYSVSSTYQYSAINSFDVLTVSPIHAVNLSAPPAGEDVEEFLLTNVGSQNLVLGNLTFSDNIPGLSRTTEIPDTDVCANNGTLAGGASCTVRIVYAPIAPVARQGTDFNIPVTSIGGVATADTTHTLPTWVASAAGADQNANINVTVTDNAAIGTGNTAIGDGTAATPYQFVLSNGHSIDFNYRFTNIAGSGPAMHFNVATSSLPIQAEVVANAAGPGGVACTGVGSAVQNLAAGDACDVVVRVPRASAVAAGLITNAATTTITLPYSWTDQAGVQTNDGAANPRSVNITTGWVTGLTTTASGSFLDDGTAYEVSVVTTITGVAANSNVTYPITVTPVFAGATNVTTCSLTDADRTCTSTFHLPTSVPQGEYSVVVRLTAGTGATASTQQTTATLNVIRGMMFLSAPLTTLAFEGYGAADALCNTDTNRPVGYRGLSYKAMLPARTDPVFVTGRDYYSNNNLDTTTTPATPRKVAAANNTQYLSTAALENAISSTANTFIALGHYTGNATTATGANCTDWTSNLATVNFVQGNVSQTGAIWRGDAAGNISTCDSVTHRLLCVAQ